MTKNPQLVEAAREIAHSCCACMPYTGMEYEVAKEAALMALNSREVPPKYLRRLLYSFNLAVAPLRKIFAVLGSGY